jgi:hypothetical protein
MPVITKDNAKLYRSWVKKSDVGEVTEYVECLGCFIDGQECVAVRLAYPSDPL